MPKCRKKTMTKQVLQVVLLGFHRIKQHLSFFFLLILCGFYADVCHAGAQREEDLSYAIRSALSDSINAKDAPKPIFLTEDQQKKYVSWKAKISVALMKKVPDDFLRSELIDMVYYEARRASLDPELVLGLISVESAFRKYAISPVGARGLMQVMPFWTRYIGNGDPNSLFDWRVNLRYGCTILRQYSFMEKDNLYFTLGRYNGSRGKPQYPNAVFAAWNKWKAVTAGD